MLGSTSTRLPWGSAMRIPIIAALLSALLSSGTAAAQCEIQRITPAEPYEDYFGRDLAAAGDTMLVGHSYDDPSGFDSGTVYVYERTPGGWVESDVLVAGDGQAYDRFGEYVAFDGERALISAFGVTHGGIDYAGAVYFFRREGADWVAEGKFLDPSPDPNTNFSRQVAIRGDDAAVLGGGHGSPGEVHTYERVGSGWRLLQTLVLPSGLPGGYGRRLAIHGGALYVGAPAAAGGGRVYVYGRTLSGWVLRAEVGPTQGVPVNFGIAISTDGTRLVVGDHLDGGVGAVHVFVLAGSSWVAEGYLRPDTVETVWFGAAVALEGARILIGAPHDTELFSVDPGAAFEFERIAGEWVQTAKIYPQDPGGEWFEGGHVREFGSRLALVDGEALCATWSDYDELASPSGAVRVFELEELGTPFCFCPANAPCANTDPIRGCDNSRGHGARLHAAGSASVASDDLRFATLILPSSQSGVLFMGTEAIEVPFGNGLRCIGEAGSGVHRFPVRVTTNWGTHLEGPGVVGFTHAQFPPSGRIQPGDTWLFQTWYRDPTGPCGQGYNVSNALSIHFEP